MSIGWWRWGLALLVGVSLGGWVKERPEAQARPSGEDDAAYLSTRAQALADEVGFAR